jgi:hypothetical protein
MLDAVRFPLQTAMTDAFGFQSRKIPSIVNRRFTFQRISYGSSLTAYALDFDPS